MNKFQLVATKMNKEIKPHISEHLELFEVKLNIILQTCAQKSKLG